MTFLSEDYLVQKLISLGLALSANGKFNAKADVEAKTADYTVAATTDPSGKLFTNRGASGAVVFTLPAASQALTGTRYRFMGHANQNITVGVASGTIATFNNAAAATVACSTANQKIGAVIEAFCDGTQWLVTGVTVGVTYTVA